MKIAVTGKGGVGKTTFSAILSKRYAQDGYNVLAVDADPDANLALALGFPQAKIEQITPIAELKDLVKDRTKSTSDTFSTMFKMNPKVDDIPAKYATEHEGVKLLSLGNIDSGGAGCICSESALLKRLMSYMVTENKDVLILDMEAGLEHLGRGTAEGVNAFIVVVEPGIRSIQTYHNVKKLAKDIGIEKVYVVANKVKTDRDKAYIQEHVGEACLGYISYSDQVAESDREGKSPFDVGTTVAEISAIKEKIEGLVLS